MRIQAEAIAKVNRLAFERENEAQLVEKIRRSNRYISQLCNWAYYV